MAQMVTTLVVVYGTRMNPTVQSNVSKPLIFLPPKSQWAGGVIRGCVGYPSSHPEDARFPTSSLVFRCGSKGQITASGRRRKDVDVAHVSVRCRTIKQFNCNLH